LRKVAQDPSIKKRAIPAVFHNKNAPFLGIFPAIFRKKSTLDKSGESGYSM
jgi:hypothetical protein